MFELDEPAVAVLLFEARQVFGKDVGVDVDFHLSALVPQFLQVDRAGRRKTVRKRAEAVSRCR